MTLEKRILIVDDNRSIHEDFTKILSIKTDALQGMDEMESLLFNVSKPVQQKTPVFIIDSAYQGEEAIEMVDLAEKQGHPYALIFMDVRMPPGINGIETIARIWETHPNIEMVICTAYSDYSWDDILNKFGETDKLLFTKKPFNVVSIKQLAHALTTKWENAKQNREYQQLLEEEVERRTSELSKLLEHMKSLKEKAENADKMKSVFLSNMSHEIRTPLNSILGFTELLEYKKNITEEKKVRFLKAINNSGKGLLILINDIIDLAKIEAGHMQFYNEFFDLNTLFRELEEFFTFEAASKGKEQIEIIKVTPDDGQSYTIETDPIRLKQVLSNLINNAIKFTNAGSVKFGFRESNDNQLYFFVEDTGIGIITEKHETIFKRFMQADMSEEEKNGTGLGLAIAHNIVIKLGGKLELKSEPGKGTVFYFSLPLQKQSTEAPSISLTIGQTTTTYNWEDKSILIAEDDEASYLLMKEVLEPTQITVYHAWDGQEAIEIYEKIKPVDIILTDIGMPKMDGFQLLNEIRAKQEQQVIIAQSGYAMSDEQKHIRDHGFNDCLEKPIDIKRLLYVLSQHISQNPEQKGQ
jgi:two-component system, sensor histidine kinase and response regulator